MASSASSRMGAIPRISPRTLLAGAALVLAAAAPATVHAQSSDATCYWPNGQAAPGDMLPCGGGGADTQNSACCNQGWTCLSNGLCMPDGQDPANLAGATIIRGACTDRSWASPDCPRWCIDSEEIDNINAVQTINACQGQAGAFYCAAGDEHDDCDEETDIIRFPGESSLRHVVIDLG